jgi:hypothetical protein
MYDNEEPGTENIPLRSLYWEEANIKQGYMIKDCSHHFLELFCTRIMNMIRKLYDCGLVSVREEDLW